MLTKSELDRKVALALGLPVSHVANVTSAFVDELCNATAQHGGFHLTGLGRLTTRLEKGGGGSTTINPASREQMRIRLYFKKSKLLKDQIERQMGIKEMSYGKRSGNDQVRRR